MYVGIDVSEEHVDVAGDDGALEARFGNDAEGHRQLVTRLRELAPRLVVMEATGNFQLELCCLLASAKLPMAVVNPRQVRHFAQALGISAKTDAPTLARFGAAVQPEVQPLPDDQSRDMEALMTRRSQLIGMIATEKNRLYAPTKKNWAEQSIRDTLNYLVEQVTQIDQDLKECIERSPVWKAEDDLLKSVPASAR
jgi:transposase